MFVIGWYRRVQRYIILVKNENKVPGCNDTFCFTTLIQEAQKADRALGGRKYARSPDNRSVQGLIDNEYYFFFLFLHTKTIYE